MNPADPAMARAWREWTDAKDAARRRREEVIRLRKRDGLYKVEVSGRFSASFEVEGGVVTRCAPIIRNNLAYWADRAVRIGDVPERKP